MEICARIYFLTLTGVMLASTAIGVVSLVTFASIHVDIVGIVNRLYYYYFVEDAPNCILFSTKIEQDDLKYVRLSGPGACDFVLAGHSLVHETMQENPSWSCWL